MFSVSFLTVFNKINLWISTQECSTCKK